MKRTLRASMVGVVLAFVYAASCAGRIVIAPDLARIGDAATWTVINTDPVTSAEDRGSVVRLFPRGWKQGQGEQRRDGPGQGGRLR